MSITPKAIEVEYEKRTGQKWPFLVPASTFLEMGKDEKFASFMLNLAGPVIRKVAIAKEKDVESK